MKQKRKCQFEIKTVGEDSKENDSQTIGIDTLVVTYSIE